MDKLRKALFGESEEDRKKREAIDFNKRADEVYGIGDSKRSKKREGPGGDGEEKKSSELDFDAPITEPQEKDMDPEIENLFTEAAAQPAPTITESKKMTRKANQSNLVQPIYNIAASAKGMLGFNGGKLRRKTRKKTKRKLRKRKRKTKKIKRKRKSKKIKRKKRKLRKKRKTRR